MRARANGGSYVHVERGEGEHDLLELYPALTNPPSLSAAVSGDPLSKVVKQLRVAFAPTPTVPASHTRITGKGNGYEEWLTPKGRSNHDLP